MSTKIEYRGKLPRILRTPGLAAVLLLAGVWWAGGRARAEALSETSAPPATAHELIAVAPPPFSEGIFPCSECHDGEGVNTTRRVVEDHADIVLHHDEENRWCLDCHDTVNRDKLHLADGRLLDFSESYRLCGQCHGTQLRDWLAGEHGKRTGSWSGTKQYLLCVSCHNPHNPRFKPLKPMPPPKPQGGEDE